MNTTSATEDTTEPDEPHWAEQEAFQLLIITFFVTQAALGFAVYHGFYWLAVPLVLVSSHLMHGMLIGLHEASHGLLERAAFLMK